jgi:hypothetical protein
VTGKSTEEDEEDKAALEVGASQPQPPEGAEPVEGKVVAEDRS